MIRELRFFAHTISPAGFVMGKAILNQHFFSGIHRWGNPVLPSPNGN